MIAARSAVFAAVVLFGSSCAHVGPPPTVVRPSPAQMAELWVDPGSEARNLFDGPSRGYERPSRGYERPTTEARFEVLERDTGGFSITYRVRDERGLEWTVKIGPEAQPEVVASRILWGLGYHQLPTFFVERWTAVQDGRDQVLGGARFRPRKPGVDGKGTWAWRETPFVGTLEYDGLLTLLVLLNSTDLKADNNELFEVEDPAPGEPRRLYIVKDLGASLGETGRFEPKRGSIDHFEREAFLRGREGPFVRFVFHGRHQDLLQHIPTVHMKWMCERVLGLSDRQLRDAFRAANYDPETTARFIARIREKAREGLALP
ncbi:MAG: hypothetical protein AB7Q29_01160 [Vicinamibacterales bacterium]